jgi:hypothetical protein
MNTHTKFEICIWYTSSSLFGDSRSPPDLFHGFHVGGGNCRVPLRFFNQNLTVDAITLIEYTHQVSSFHLQNSGRDHQKTNFDCQIFKKVGGGYGNKFSIASNSLTD